MKPKHDAILVLGYRFDDGWTLPDYLRKGLKKAAKMYRDGVAPKIIVCGKWSLWFDENKVVPPFTEAAAMKKALIELGVRADDVYEENFSKDTIGNAYFAKTKITRPRRFHNLLIVCAQFHLPRVQYIFEKVFGPEYKLTYNMVLTHHDPSHEKMQKELLRLQKKFLSHMTKGEDTFLKDRLYSDPFYRK